MEWTRETANEYRAKLNRRVAELAEPGVPLHVTGQKAADELLTFEEQESFQKWREDQFLEGLKRLRAKRS